MWLLSLFISEHMQSDNHASWKQDTHFLPLALPQVCVSARAQRFALASVSEPGHVWVWMGNCARGHSTCQLPAPLPWEEEAPHRGISHPQEQRRREAAVPGHVPAAAALGSPRRWGCAYTSVAVRSPQPDPSSCPPSSSQGGTGVFVWWWWRGAQIGEFCPEMRLQVPGRAGQSLTLPSSICTAMV